MSHHVHSDGVADATVPARPGRVVSLVGTMETSFGAPARKPAVVTLKTRLAPGWQERWATFDAIEPVR